MTTANLTTPLCLLAIYVDSTEEELTARLAGKWLLDDWHLPAIDTDTARAMTIEYRDAKRAAQAAQRAVEAERAETERAERDRRAAADQAEQVARQARADRQRELLAADPTLDAVTLMKLTDDDDRRMDVAGVMFDQLYQAERANLGGVGYRLTPTPTNQE